MKRRASVEHQHQAAVIRWATLATPRIPMFPDAKQLVSNQK